MSSHSEPPPEASRDPLIDKLRETDPAEWEKAFPKLWPAAKAGVRKNPYPHFSDRDIEDFVIVAIAQVHKKLREKKICHPYGKFPELLGIVHVTALRRSLDESRKRGRQKTDPTGDPIETESSQSYAPIPVSHTLPSMEDVFFALKKLPPPQPEIYLACHRGEQSRHDIARTYGMTYANVNQIFCRVTKWLHNWFKGEGGASV